LTEIQAGSPFVDLLLKTMRPFTGVNARWSCGGTRRTACIACTAAAPEKRGRPVSIRSRKAEPARPRSRRRRISVGAEKWHPTSRERRMPVQHPFGAVRRHFPNSTDILSGNTCYMECIRSRVYRGRRRDAHIENTRNLKCSDCWLRAVDTSPLSWCGGTSTNPRVRRKRPKWTIIELGWEETYRFAVECRAISLPRRSPLPQRLPSGAAAPDPSDGICPYLPVQLRFLEEQQSVVLTYPATP